MSKTPKEFVGGPADGRTFEVTEGTLQFVLPRRTQWVNLDPVSRWYFPNVFTKLVYNLEDDGRMRFEREDDLPEILIDSLELSMKHGIVSIGDMTGEELLAKGIGVRREAVTP